MKLRNLLAVIVLLLACSVFGQQRTITGFYWPIGTSQFSQGNGTWGSTHRQGGYFKGQVHIGVDMLCPIGTPVFSIANGEVIYKNSSFSWGSTNRRPNYCLVVRHRTADGIEFIAFYGHLKDIVDKRFVNAGEKIGTIGDWAHGQHLHFGIRVASTFPASNWGSMPEANWPNSLNGFVDPVAWIQTKSPSLTSLPDGLYKPTDEASVFWIRNLTRRAFTSAEAFELWMGPGAWHQVKTVPPDDIFLGTDWAPPLPFLPLLPDGSVHFVPESFNREPHGSLVSRPITSSQTFLQMFRTFDDTKLVGSSPGSSSWNPDARFGRMNLLISQEPYMITTDGPFMDRRFGNYISGGFRIRNMSQSTARVEVTIRAVRSDRQWFDFPWSPKIEVGPNQEYVWWSDRSLPPGVYEPKVIYSFWNQQGVNIQQRANSAGLNPLPYSRTSVNVP